MKIKLNEIILEFSDEQMAAFLRNVGYKIETHEVTFSTIVGSYKRECKIAIPKYQTYNPMKHKSMDDTFKEIFEDNIRNFLLNLQKY